MVGHLIVFDVREALVELSIQVQIVRVSVIQRSGGCFAEATTVEFSRSPVSLNVAALHVYELVHQLTRERRVDERAQPRQ
jgi:hypothetical protein